MTVYLVIQEGIYRHDIRGVFSSLEAARERARQCAAEDCDDYHAYVVSSMRLDEGAEDSSEPIASYAQKGGRGVKWHDDATLVERGPVRACGNYPKPGHVGPPACWHCATR
jgi:hypothetical protein